MSAKVTAGREGPLPKGSGVLLAGGGARRKATCEPDGREYR